MHNPSIGAPANNRLVKGAFAAIDPPCLISGHASLLATEFCYKKGSEIYGEEERAEYVYQVIRGAVRSYRLMSDGRRQIAAFHLPGDIFGLETGPVHGLTAEAIIDTAVRLIKRRNLDETAATDIHVIQDLLHMPARNLKRAEDHMLLLGRKTAIERVANFLLEMDSRLAVAGMMDLPMCRRDIGDYLGLTLETVSRALSQLQDQGVLGFSGARQIRLRDRQQLQDLDA